MIRDLFLRLLPSRAPVIGISLFFRWYDLWVGVYIDRHSQAVYICPIPMCGIKLWVVRWEDV